MDARLQLILFGGTSSASGSTTPPANTVAPAVTGTETEGETLSCTTGTWTGTATISYTYQWYQAITSGDDPITDGDGNYLGDPIVGATSSTYDLTADDVDELIFCDVTATNLIGSALKSSNVTGRIAAAPAGLLLDALTTNLTAAYSLRQLLTAYAGSAIRVRRSSDDTESDIGFVAGELDTATLLTFCGAGNGFIRKWYDQSGNGRDFGMATALAQPQIVASGSLKTVNSKAALFFDGSLSRLTSTATVANLATASAWTAIGGIDATVITLADPPGYGSGTVMAALDTYWNPLGVSTFSATPKFTAANYTSGDVLTKKTVALNTPFVGVGRLGSGTLSAYVNGGTPDTAASGNVGGTTGTLEMGREQTSTLLFGGYLADLIFFNAAMSSANINTIGADVAARVGSTWTTI